MVHRIEVRTTVKPIDVLARQSLSRAASACLTRSEMHASAKMLQTHAGIHERNSIESIPHNSIWHVRVLYFAAWGGHAAALV